ncbi:MAG TPA: tRNA 2-selenouridine(34) synthase MnmH [Puia sp.]
MAVEKISIECFIEYIKKNPVLDVRSPGEFTHAHIPCAHSLPLFTDDERKIIGTAYKQESREKAIKIGLQYFGTRMVQIVETVEPLTESSKKEPEVGHGKTVLVHCWRGGMRSEAVAWLLDLYGFKVLTLSGGYKVFRRWVLQQFEKSYSFQVIGGYTGSGKTDMLQHLKATGETIIDLEELACHKGSAFGNLESSKQPSQELFENMLALALYKARCKQQTIWIEDESQRIGDVNIPAKLYRSKQSGPVYFIDVPFEERLKFITSQYGKFEKEHLINAIVRINRRLGSLETKRAINYLVEDDIENCFAILLRYYDKYYEKSLSDLCENTKRQIYKIHSPDVNAETNAQLLLKTSYNILEQ